MKKTGAKRVSGFESGLGSAVLTAPEESFASAGGRKGPAPAGALQRGFSREYDERGADGYGQDDSDFVSPRERGRPRLRTLMRSVGGRIVLGVGAFVLLGAGVVAFAGARSYLMHDPRLVVSSSDDIQITGAEHLTRDQIVSVFGPDLERNIFRVSLAERQADLERLPWVAHATVMRLLPDVLRVQITERTPVAFVRQGSQIGLVDGSGVLLDMPADAAGDPQYSFPVLTGLSANEALSERASKMEIYEQFLRELDGSGARLSASVSEVDVADPEDVKALITSGNSDVLVHFGQEDFLKRYKEFEEHLPEWKQQYPKLASADMRYDGQIVLEMQGDGHADGMGSSAAEVASVERPAPAAPIVASRPAAMKPAANAKATAGTKTLTAKPKVIKPAAMKAATIPLSNPTASKPTVASASKPAAASASKSPLASDVAILRAAAPKPVNLNGAASKPVATAKAVPVKAGHPAARTVPVKPGHATPRPVASKGATVKARPGSGMSAANEKVFARLAAEHRAELAREHKTATVAKSGKTVKSAVMH